MEGIRGLSGWGVYGPNEWDSYGKMSYCFFGKYSPKNTGLQGSTLSSHRMTMVFVPFEVNNYSQYYHCCEASRIEEEDLSKCVECACYLSATTIVMYSLPHTILGECV